MNWDAISALGTIIGSIAVLVTLIYLAVQIRQNTEAINAQSRQSILAAAQAEIFLRIQFPELEIAITQDDVPTQVEQVKINAWLAGVFRSREFSWLQYNQGLIDESQWSTEVNVISIVLSAPRARDWWEIAGRKSFGQKFVHFVDEVIRDQPASLEFARSLGSWAKR